MNNVYTKNYYSAVKKEWNLAICNIMGGSRGHNVKWNKSNMEDRYHMISLIFGI